MLEGYEVCDLSVLQDPPEVEETGTTFLENASLKALAISELTEALVLSDDSGLEVDALNGQPGVYSSSYGGEEGNDAKNNAKLLRTMGGKTERSGRFQCVMVLAQGGKALANFTGSVEGEILEEKQGSGGFGYDPLFSPVGHQGSFAQLGEEVKNTMSHRARALSKVVGWLEERSEHTL